MLHARRCVCLGQWVGPPAAPTGEGGRGAVVVELAVVVAELGEPGAFVGERVDAVEDTVRGVVPLWGRAKQQGFLAQGRCLLGAS